MRYDPCPCCGGELETLGGLGNNTFYQCRDCGLECFKPARVPKRQRRKPARKISNQQMKEERDYA